MAGGFHLTVGHVVITGPAGVNCSVRFYAYEEIRVKASYLAILAAVVVSAGMVGKAFAEEPVKLSAVPIQNVRIEDRMPFG